MLENETSGIVRKPVGCFMSVSSEKVRGWGFVVTSKSPMGQFRATSTCEVPTFCTVMVQELIEGSLCRLLTRIFFVNIESRGVNLTNSPSKVLPAHCNFTSKIPRTGTEKDSEQLRSKVFDLLSLETKGAHTVLSLSNRITVYGVMAMTYRGFKIKLAPIIIS